MKFLPGVFRLKTRAHAIQILSYSTTTVTRSEPNGTRILLESLEPTPKTLANRKTIFTELDTKLKRWNDRYYLKDVSLYQYAHDIDQAPIQLAIVDKNRQPANDEMIDLPSSVATALEARGYAGSFYSPLAAKINALENSFLKVYTSYVPWPNYSGQEPKGYAYPPILHITATPSVRGVPFDLLLPGPHTVPLLDLFHKIYSREEAKQALSLVFAWTRRLQMLRFSDTAIAIMLGAVLQENRQLSLLEILTHFFHHWSKIDYLQGEAVSISQTNEPYVDPDKHTYNESPLVVQDPFVPSKNHAERVSMIQLRRFKDASAAALKALEAKEPLHTVLRLERPMFEKSLLNDIATQDDGGFDIEYVHKKYLIVPEEVQKRRGRTLDAVQRALAKPFGKTNRVVFFGSVRYGITIASSDLDMIIIDPSRRNGLGPGDEPTAIYNIRKVADALRKARFTNIQVIAWGSVPIVKFRDPRTGFDCDINVNERLGLYNSNLINAYCTLSPLLRPLLMLIKLWAKPLDLNSPSPTMMGVKHTPSFSSYALALMTISFMQTRGLLPNLQDGLPPLGPDDTTGIFWYRSAKGKNPVKCDVRYHREIAGWEPSAYPKLKEVLRDWFLYWSHGYQYHKQAASIRHGGLCEPDNNRSELDSGRASPGVQPSVIKVLDPFIRTKNVTRAISSNVLKQFVDQCQEAANVLEGANSLNELIGKIEIPEASHNIEQKKTRKTQWKKERKSGEAIKVVDNKSVRSQLNR